MRRSRRFMCRHIFGVGCATLAVMTAAVGSAAASASVTNRDTKDYKITVIEGEKKQDHTLKPNQILEGICLKGCVIRLDDNEDDEYQLEENDAVSIEDGQLYYDNAEPEPEPEPKKK
jgi:hypothetical protein